MPIDAVVFDMDGVLLHSEEVWNASKEAVIRENGGRWRDDAPRSMMGMSSAEWSRYMHDELGVPLPPERIDELVVQRMRDTYEHALPLIPGADEAVRRIANRWPLAVASSSNRPIIDLALELAGLDGCFQATVSSEEVGRGKPAPDVYLEAAARLGADPRRCAAVEDSTNGILSAHAAGMKVIAIPNPTYPPEPHGLDAADVVLESIEQLTTEVVESLA
ncbi:MAG TPA: HAD family phosphatase [Thermoleophilaceae bacterium]